MVDLFAESRLLGLQGGDLHDVGFEQIDYLQRLLFPRLGCFVDEDSDYVNESSRYASQLLFLSLDSLQYILELLGSTFNCQKQVSLEVLASSLETMETEGDS